MSLYFMEPNQILTLPPKKNRAASSILHVVEGLRDGRKSCDLPALDGKHLHFKALSSQDRLVRWDQANL